MKKSTRLCVGALVGLISFAAQDAAAYRYYLTDQNEKFQLDPYWGNRHMIHISGCSWGQPEHAWVNEIEIAAAEWNEVRSMKDVLAVKWRHCSVMNTLAKKQSKIYRTPIRGSVRGQNLPTVNASTGLVRRVRVLVDSTDSELFSADSHPCDEHNSSAWVRRIVMHEFGHSLGLAHGNYVHRLNLMYEENRPSLYCGTGSQVLPDADDADGGRFLYPATTPHRDLATLSWSSPAGLLLPIVGLDPVKICPGEVHEQNWTVANRGTTAITYNRRFYFSDDAVFGDADDQYAGIFQGETKEAGTPFGEFSSGPSKISGITMPTLNATHRLMMSLGGSDIAAQSPGTSKKNDWTYFRMRFAANDSGCP